MPVVFAGILAGCGGGASSDENTPTFQSDPPEQRIISDPLYSQQWSIHYDETFFAVNRIDSQAHIHAEDGLERYSGAGVRVAIIDDGLDTGHDDLKGALVRSFDSQTGSFDVDYTSWNQGHGTAVVGLIAARENDRGIKGIASRSEIIFLKYQKSMNDSDLVELFTRAEEFGADVINCSWGTGFVSRAVTEVIRDLAINGRGGRGIPIVFAAGNNYQPIGRFDEAAIPEVITVGASDEENLRAPYSNWGGALDLVAPGGHVYGQTTLDLSGADGEVNGDYLFYDDPVPFSGTSAAAPIVTGAIAVLLEINPELTREQIVNILQQTADKIGTLDYIDGRNDYYGYGKLNLAAAVVRVLEVNE